MGASQISSGPTLAEPSVVKRAAQYVRASTDHQSYSTENQEHAIQTYATLHNMQLVRSYSDQGKSGLNIAGRLGLQELISDVQSGRASYDCILVYDISRWWRFQDIDESAHYEYICKRANIQVIYCAEHFKNDGSIVSTIIKSLKRSMAAEYSRELSEKVFLGQCRLIEKGFRQGGRAGFGFRRMLVGPDGQHKEILSQGSLKNIQSDRIVLIKGPDKELSTVRKMFDLFVFHNMRETEIAKILNNDNILTDTGRHWARGTVHCILTNEKYIGNNVFGRSTAKLKDTRVPVPESQWIRRDGAFEGIVEPEIFWRAQSIIRAGKKRNEPAEMIGKLSKLYRRRGIITEKLIKAQRNMPAAWVYKAKFGSLLEAYWKPIGSLDIFQLVNLVMF
jgi:DNA invertase Pin-like site-specific DNA recombinase